MNDPNLTLDERRVLEALRTQPGSYGTKTERELNTKRAVLNSLVRRKYIRDLGGGVFQLTQEGQRAITGNRDALNIQ